MSYLIMLIVMAYNVWLFVVIVAGLAVGCAVGISNAGTQTRVVGCRL